MFSIDIDCRQEEKDILIADLWGAGSTGIIEVSDTIEDGERFSRVRAFFDDDAKIPEIHTMFGGKVESADTRDWVAFAREYLKPMLIGERIFVIPDWYSDATPPGRIRIEINAGLAFGTGAHETTRMCMQALERHLKPGDTVVDVGTGSGILSEAAMKLGAARAFASDTDPSAVVVARENFERAGVAVGTFTGSANAFAGGIADIVVANISPAWISDLAYEWLRILKPGGLAILSGFENADVPVVSRALEAAGAAITHETGEIDWRMLEIRRA